MLTGGCFCGRVRYEAHAAPFNPSICHCSMCRRSAGAPFVAWFSVPRSGFRLAGEPVRYRSSGRATRTFCPHCGTQLTFELDSAPQEEIDITICSLDEPERVAPADHIYVSSKLSWVKLSDELPQFSQQRPAPAASP